MACGCSNSVALSNIALTCEPSRGGIKKVLATPYADNIFSKSGETITGISSSITWSEICIRKNTGSLSSELQKDDANSVFYYNTTLNLVFNKMSATNRAKINALSLNELTFLVQDANNVWHIVGLDLPAVITTSTAETGTAIGDGNRYSLSFVAEESELPVIISDTIAKTAKIASA